MDEQFISSVLRLYKRLNTIQSIATIVSLLGIIVWFPVWILMSFDDSGKSWKEYGTLMTIAFFVILFMALVAVFCKITSASYEKKYPQIFRR